MLTDSISSFLIPIAISPIRVTINRINENIVKYIFKALNYYKNQVTYTRVNMLIGLIINSVLKSNKDKIPVRYQAL